MFSSVFLDTKSLPAQPCHSNKAPSSSGEGLKQPRQQRKLKLWQQWGKTSGQGEDGSWSQKPCYFYHRLLVWLEGISIYRNLQSMRARGSCGTDEGMVPPLSHLPTYPQQLPSSATLVTPSQT